MEPQHQITSRIVISCYHQRSREGEHFVSDHTLSHIISGSMTFNDGDKEYPKEAGDLHLVRRNQLLKYVKYPPEGGEFKSLSITFDQDALRSFSGEYGVSSRQASSEYIISFSKDALLQNFVQSILQYHASEKFNSPAIIDLKVKECLLLLLQTNPDVADILFDFADPHKIDLEAFMNRNYHFNVNIERFAYLTGRSLATFKRDFEKIFQLPPHRWLLQRRLREALYLIQKKGKSSSEIYLDLGFEDLSHFSYAFKRQFGLNPTDVTSTTS